MDNKTNTLGRSFRWLNATQFLGAANDNLFRGLMIFLIISRLGQEYASQVSSIAGLVFVVPFLLLTPFAGTLADRFSKRNIIVLVKIAEIITMVLGCLAFMTGEPVLCYGVMFLMAAHSAFFGPCKYGILPELVKPYQLSKANGILEASTYLAIIMGIAAAPFLTRLFGENYPLAGCAAILVAVTGTLTSLGIEKTPAGGTASKASLLFFMDIWKTLHEMRKQRDLIVAIFGGGAFMFLGGFAQVNLIPYGIEVCRYDQVQSGYLFLLAAVGIGAGSYLAGRLSGRSVESGLIPFSLLILSGSAIGLWLAEANWFVFVMIALMGLGAGLYIVPVYAYIQLYGPKDSMGRLIAATNFIGWMGVALASGLVGLGSGVLKMTAAQLFGLFGCFGLILTVIAAIYLREYAVRLFLAKVIKAAYRIRVFGEENVPLKTGALLVANHVSWVDGLALNAALHRRVSFIIDRGIYNRWYLNWLFRIGRAIPISAQDGPRQIVQSLHHARKAIEDGCLVCIFAEGTLTRTGHMLPFRAGLEKIAKAADSPIIPVFLGGLWESFATYHYGMIFSSRPKILPYPVTVHFGKPMDKTATAEQIRQAIMELSPDWIEDRKYRRLSLGQMFAKCARRNWKYPCIADVTGKKLSYGQTLIASLMLAGKLKALVGDRQNIGIMLPSSVGGALANIAVALLARTAVNLNYTVSQADRQTAVEQCGIVMIITSRVLLEKLGFEAGDNKYVFIEDILASVSKSDKYTAAVRAILMPARFLTGLKRIDPDSTAMILYSSGSSARPKGIMLSHHNILSNIECARMVYKFDRTARLAGVLPFFHSFGLTCTLWLPILSNASACYQPNPLEAKAVGQMIVEHRCTMLFTTPTFLLSYIRRCEREQFVTLNLIVVGAEKMKIELADSFEKRFGIRPVEGYGATELSPLAAYNVPDRDIDEFKQQGTKEGTVGMPIPGVATRVTNPETGEILGSGQTGLLWIKGANVMKGYLNDPQRTADVIVDGWYNTGDLVLSDEKGFITIVDRLSRFSKIAGEMVSHTAIEQVCYDGLNVHERVVAVVGVPDEKKGEQIKVLYVQSAVDGDRLYEAISSSGLPNIAKPRRDSLIPVDELPTLGSGKMDIQRIKKIAMEHGE